MKWFANYLSGKTPEMQLDEMLDEQSQAAYDEFELVLAQITDPVLHEAIADAARQYGMMRGELGLVAGLTAAVDPRPWLLNPHPDDPADDAGNVE